MINALLNILFPNLCCSCSTVLKDNEKLLCTVCRHELAVTAYSDLKNNPVINVFKGRVKIEYATALLRFEKNNSTQQLIHQLKYKNQQDIGSFFGMWLGEELSKSAISPNIDAVIPVPLHKKRLKQRGYNQVTTFGTAIANVLQTAFYDDVLIKTSNTKSQVDKTRWARWQDKDHSFELKNADKINNKHILLVDDVVTTGATLEASALTLQKANNVKISIATIAIA